MIGDVGVHRIDYGDIVHVLCGVAEQFTDVDPGLAILLELERRGQRDSGFALGFERDGQLLTVSFLQFGFVVKRIDVRRATVHEQVDHAFGFSREMRNTRLHRVLNQAVLINR